MGLCPDAEEIPHLEVARFVDPPEDASPPPKRKKLLLLPRGSFKSHLVTISLSAREIARDPDIRILIASETYKLAKRHFGVVKQVLESPSGPFFETFGSLRRDPGWTDEFFTVSTRTRVLREPSLSCAGIDMTTTGLHYDLVFLDDPVSPNNVKTPEAIASTITWMRELLSQLYSGDDHTPPGRLIVVGTRHHYADLYGHILREEKDQYDVLVRGCYDGPEDLFFPKVLTREFLLEQERAQGSSLFAAWYLNQAVSPKETLVSSEKILVIPDSDVPEGCRVTLLTDTAVTENDRSCFSVLIVAALDAERRAYVRDVRLGHWKPEEFVRHFFDLFERWRPSPCLFEKIGLNAVYKALLGAEARRRQVWPHILDVPGRSQTTKFARIQSLQPRFEQGSILFTEKVARSEAWTEMWEEMTNWPHSTSNDFLDALSDLDRRSSTDVYLVPRAVKTKPFSLGIVNGRFASEPPREGEESRRSRWYEWRK